MQIEFFESTTLDRAFDDFADARMTAAAVRPETRPQRFCCGTPLQQNAAAGIDDVQRKRTMQHAVAGVTFIAAGLADNTIIGVNQ